MEKLSITEIENGFNSEDNDIRMATLKTCLNGGYDYIPLEVIKRWKMDGNCRLRWMSMHACLCRPDIPIDVILDSTNDEDEWVRMAAFTALNAYAGK